MKAREWERTLSALRDESGKQFYRSTELANISGANYRFIATTLTRLVKSEVLVRYASGIYGLPGNFDIPQLARTIDSNAYVTGADALYYHGLITQEATGKTCFTSRRHNRSRVRPTRLGTLTFICVSAPVYHPPDKPGYPSAAQALLDFAYITRRNGAEPQGIATLAKLDTIPADALEQAAARYPESVRKSVEDMIEAFMKG